MEFDITSFEIELADLMDKFNITEFWHNILRNDEAWVYVKNIGLKRIGKLTPESLRNAKTH